MPMPEKLDVAVLSITGVDVVLVYCAIICTPCRRNTHSRGEHRAAAQGAALLESELGN
jgi:hypothetical protein